MGQQGESLLAQLRVGGLRRRRLGGGSGPEWRCRPGTNLGSVWGVGVLELAQALSVAPAR